MLICFLRVAGVAAIVLALTYPIYPMRFRWRKQLERVAPLTRQIFWVHCGFILILLGLQGVLYLFFPQVLMEDSAAAVALLIGLSAFWLFRLIAQLFIFDRGLWVGNRSHTIVHITFLVIWFSMSGVNLWALATHLR